jgi:hypothetical protein
MTTTIALMKRMRVFMSMPSVGWADGRKRR